MAWACDRDRNARRQQIAPGAVDLHCRGDHVLRHGIAAIQNGNRSVAVDGVAVDAVGCSGVEERIGGRHGKRLRGNPVVVRRAGENRKGSAAADAESGKESIVSIARHKDSRRCWCRRRCWFEEQRNHRNRSHRAATDNTNPVFGASMSLTSNGLSLGQSQSTRR